MAQGGLSGLLAGFQHLILVPMGATRVPALVFHEKFPNHCNKLTIDGLSHLYLVSAAWKQKGLR